jgi:3-hydroxyacyl-CoA dehydrogenase/enoyl-CoA hydratase/3-hydroxybutyryl-CoA epimerase
LFFHRRGKSVNVLDKQLLEKIEKMANQIDDKIKQSRIKVLVLYSLKKNSFIVGADVNMIYSIDDEKEAEAIAREGQLFLNRLEQTSIPTVAAIHGACMGGGFEVTLACTYRIASSNRITQIGLPEVKLGLIPGAGGTVRLSRMIGLKQALQLILTGATLSPQKARSLQIVDELIEYDNESTFFEKVRKFASNLPEITPIDKYSRRKKSFSELLFQNNPIGRSFMSYKTTNFLNTMTKGHYPAPYIILDTMIKGYSSTFDRALELEAKSFGKLVCTPEAKNLIALFLMIEETKKPELFVNPSRIIQVKKIGIIGAGQMGAGIAQLAALKNYYVYMKDVDDQLVQLGMQKINTLFQNMVNKKKITPAEKEKYMSRITAGTDYSALKDVEIVIEAAVERLDIKQEIVSKIYEINPLVIFASNTSSIPISTIAEHSKNRKQMIGMHFFNPVHRMPLLEIIKTKDSSQEAIATAYQLALQFGKIPILVHDGPGFLTTRLFAVYCVEASRIALEGIPFEEIDRQLMQFGMPMGAFRVMDESGLDIAINVQPILSKSLDFDQYHALNELVKVAGATGKKVGRGFYIYDTTTGEKIGVNADALKIFHKYMNQRTIIDHIKNDIIDRCILTLVNEASKCLDEGRVRTPEDVDLAMIMGFGFPPFKAGYLLRLYYFHYL